MPTKKKTAKRKVSKNSSKNKKDIILVVGLPAPSVVSDFLVFKKKEKKYKIAVVYNSKEKLTDSQKKTVKKFDIAIPCNLKSSNSIAESLAPYQDRFKSVTCRAEAKIPEFQKIIPHVPYLRTPTATSLDWSTNKALMRKRFAIYDKSITPKYKIVKDTKKGTIRDISKYIDYPLIVKPAGLAQSMLVNIVYHEEELVKILRKSFRHIKNLYKEAKGRGEPTLVVEQFMEGEMYSVDAFVNSLGKVYFAPIVHVKTGRAIGFDDFFAYRTITPTALKKSSIEKAQVVAEKAIHAVGLRSSSAHVELMRTESGWKVIELGPRLGGFRSTMYDLSYGISATANDIYIRMPKKPILPKKISGYTAVFKMFPKKEGYLKSIKGVKRSQGLKSFHSIALNKAIGDRVRFAKNGGKSVFNITFFNKNRAKLLADIRRFEQMVEIGVD